jgi:hypothetical protein
MHPWLDPASVTRLQDHGVIRRMAWANGDRELATIRRGIKGAAVGVTRPHPTLDRVATCCQPLRERRCPHRYPLGPHGGAPSGVCRDGDVRLEPFDVKRAPAEVRLVHHQAVRPARKRTIPGQVAGDTHPTPTGDKSNHDPSESMPLHGHSTVPVCRSFHSNRGRSPTRPVQLAARVALRPAGRLGSCGWCLMLRGLGGRRRRWSGSRRSPPSGATAPSNG